MTQLSWNVMVIDADERSYFTVVIAESVSKILHEIRRLKFSPEAPPMTEWRVLQISERPPL